ncbi:MAG: hypothetical protein WD069_21435 [Planctomycetales bacterium]
MNEPTTRDWRWAVSALDRITADTAAGRETSQLDLVVVFRMGRAATIYRRVSFAVCGVIGIVGGDWLTREASGRVASFWKFSLGVLAVWLVARLMDRFIFRPCFMVALAARIARTTPDR